MSIERKELLKNILKELHKGTSIEDLKNKLKEVLSEIPPFEIPLIEQELVKEGIAISEIIKLCDLHVELLRDLLKLELKVPRGHPLDLLSRENEKISRLAELLNLHAIALSKAKLPEEIENHLKSISNTLNELKKFRSHYRKIQMLIFPYLERRGIISVPRVLWNKEDQVILKIRNLSNIIEDAFSNHEHINEIVEKSFELSRELLDLIFREEKILFPSLWVIFSEGEWAAIHEIAKEMGYLVEIDVEWKSEAKPLLPYEIVGNITSEQMEKLPRQFITSLTPDKYEIKSKEDFEFDNGFLNKEEIEAIFNHLPIEITYADSNNRVVFFSQSIFRKGFVRTKTILGRRFEFCHPPRLENFVSSVVNELISGKSDFKEYWTRLGDRIIRVMVIGVKNKHGEHLGILEMVEDLTEIVNNPEEVKKKIVIL